MRSAVPNVRSAFGVDLDLVDPGEPVLDRVLDGDDVDLRPADLGERRAERGRLARSGRAGHEEGARRPADDRRQLLAHRLREAERLERRRLPRLVDQAHHDLLALDGGQHGDPDVEQAADGARVEGDPAVLRLAALGDVELREHLEPRGDTSCHALRDPLRLGEHAVDACPDHQHVVLGLEVDVAGAVAGGAHDDRVDEPHQRRVRHSVVDLEIVLVLDDLELVEHRLGLGDLRLLGEAVELVDDVLAVGDVELDRRAASRA